MRVVVISPEQSVFDGDADQVVAPAFDGEVGILPRHAPFMTLLGNGVLAVKQGATTSRFQVSGGFLQVLQDTVRVVAGEARTA
ncbi:MAG TPA: ATP synthase F1 subunit epsilon [Gemmatimonadales bacterium]|nr:ATP synthase F1 subunit epsilon [Gemmatimonadales bacterium]